MERNIIIKNTAVTLIALVIFAVFALFVMDYNIKEQGKDNIVALAQIYAGKFEFSGGNDYSSFTQMPEAVKNNIRVTVIDKNGVVLSDSLADAAAMENHINRPEVINAIKGTPEVSIRTSNTFGVSMAYYALKVYNPDSSDYLILRVSGSIKNINGYIYSAIPLIIILLAAVACLSAFFTFGFNRSLVFTFKSIERSLKKINNGTYEKVMPRFKYQELNNAVIGLNDIQQKINGNISRLNLETQKLDYVLENIEQGIIALDAEMNIVLINSAANVIFGLNSPVTGKNLLYTGCGKEINEKITALVKNGGGIFETEFNGRIYSVVISVKNNKSAEAVVIFTDITAIKRMESLRSDFFANASHELKTPITSIIGFSELLENENDTANIKKYVSFIIKDSRRMLRLIDDMLKLSRLDSNVEQGKRQNLELSEIAGDVKEGLLLMAEQKKITVEVSGEAKLYANRENMYELMENLLSNAIRYNNDNGRVWVRLYSKNNKAVIEVKDNGIGIDKIHQERIFERFYRVDKGRSKNTGGTGLGLSIVKHIVSLYNGSIELESEINKGTMVRVIL